MKIIMKKILIVLISFSFLAFLFSCQSTDRQYKRPSGYGMGGTSYGLGAPNM